MMEMEKRNGMEPWPARRAASLAVVLGISLAHLARAGQLLSGTAFELYYSYFSDVALPLAGYFMLAAAEPRAKALRAGWVKWLAAFGVAAFAETCQGVGLPLLGETFDPWDYLAYGLGATLALGADICFSKLFRRDRRVA